MALKVLPPITKEFFLTKTDIEFKNEGAPTFVIVRKATNGNEIERNRLFAQIKREIAPNDVVSFTSDVSIDDLKCKEVFLTLAGCNIGHDDSTLFRFRDDHGVLKLSMSEDDFNVAFGKLPYSVASEISDCVQEMNHQWKVPEEYGY